MTARSRVIADWRAFPVQTCPSLACATSLPRGPLLAAGIDGKGPQVSIGTLQCWTSPLSNFNGLGETELPHWSFQLRLLKAF